MAVLTNIVASYSFDTVTGNLVDATGNGNTLTNTGTTPFTTAKIGEGPDFDGSSNRRLGIASALGLTSAGDYTWANWIKFNSFNGAYFLDHVSNSGAQRRIILYAPASVVRLYVSGNELSSGTLSTGVYYWVCVEKVGTTFELFIDNVSQGTVASGSYGANTNVVSIGCPYDGFGNRSNSQMDIWNFWSRAIGSTDRATVFNAGVGAQYPFASAFTPTPMMHMMGISGGLM